MEIKTVVVEKVAWKKFDLAHAGYRFAEYCSQELLVPGVKQWGEKALGSFYFKLRAGSFLMPDFEAQQLDFDASGLKLSFIGPMFEGFGPEEAPVALRQTSPVIVLSEQTQGINGRVFSVLRPRLRSHVHKIAGQLAVEMNDVYGLERVDTNGLPSIVVALEFPKNLYSQGRMYTKTAFL